MLNVFNHKDMEIFPLRSVRLSAGKPIFPVHPLKLRAWATTPGLGVTPPMIVPVRLFPELSNACVGVTFVESNVQYPTGPEPAC